MDSALKNLSDAVTTLKILKEKTHHVFEKERDWGQFHSLKNLSMNIAIEAAELMEHFVWLTTTESDEQMNNAASAQEIKHELADVLIGVVHFAHHAQIDLTTVFMEKMALLEKKYPVDKAKGKRDKYTSYLKDKRKD